jgi:exodeoxyribonuclease-5
MTDLTTLADLVGVDITSTPASRSTPPTARASAAAGGMRLAPQQAEAVDVIRDWYADHTRQVCRLFGYAGTGKTTLAKHIVEMLGVRALYAAYTGKAAYVLRSKGCEAASTIHSLIYTPTEKVRERLDELIALRRTTDDPREAEVLDQQIATERDRLSTPDFILKEPEESLLYGAPILVLDEVSMVGAKVAADLLSFGVKILCLGDPAQLPPVDGAGYFINATPDYLLTEIHRSALDSPVTRLATAVRQAPSYDRTLGLGHGLDGDSGRMPRVDVDELLEFDQVLVGTNKTRWAAVFAIRAAQGLTGTVPMAGDKIIGLANSTECNIFNGQQFRVLEAHPQTREDRITLRVEDDLGNQRLLTTWTAGYRSVKGESEARRDGRGNIAATTWGQAITVHKSQGSQWDSVLVVDESYVFARGAAEDATRDGATPADASEAGHLGGQRWLYTAITRAAERVVVIPGSRGLPL